MAYATSSDLTRLGIASGALTGLSSETIAAALDAASSLADGYLAAQFTLPLTSWGDDLKQHVCSIAAWRLLSTRGFDPQAGNDVAVRTGYEDAIHWLDRVAAGRLSPQVVDSTPEVDNTGPVFAFSHAPRGW